MVVRSLVLVVSLMLAACGPSLQVTPHDHDLNLAGQWSMTVAEHDRLVNQLRMAVEQSRQKDDLRARHMAERQRDREDVAGPPMDMSWLRQDREQEMEALIKVAVPSIKLVVEQHGLDTVDFRSEGVAQRHFDTRNSSTLITTLATWHVTSGWQDNSFVVFSRDATQGMTITERYRRGGDVLFVTVTLSMPDVKLGTLSASYRLAG